MPSPELIVAGILCGIVGALAGVGSFIIGLYRLLTDPATRQARPATFRLLSTFFSLLTLATLVFVTYHFSLLLTVILPDAPPLAIVKRSTLIAVLAAAAAVTLWARVFVPFISARFADPLSAPSSSAASPKEPSDEASIS